MTDTMIERVARAIAKSRMFQGEMGARLAQSAAEDPVRFEGAFERLWAAEFDECQREASRSDARAAIEAMTEPTPAMLDDMRHEIGMTMHITLPDYALIAAWKMAVLASLSDAALQETKG